MRLQYSISHRRSDVVCISHLLSDVRTTVYRRSDVAFMYLLLFTGVQECSPLMLLYLFDLVWDILPDMMHINTGIWHRHFLKMLTGTRFPATVKSRKKNSAKENKALAEDHKACVNHLKSWVLTQVQRYSCLLMSLTFLTLFRRCFLQTHRLHAHPTSERQWPSSNVRTFPQAEGEKLDARGRSLAGEPSWIRSNVEIYSHGANLTAHDWLQVVQSAGDYVLANLFPDYPHRMEAIHALLAVCSKILRATSAVDSNNREDLDALKLEVVVALCHCEAAFPRTEMAVMFHILLHVPDAIYKWNNVRNFWSFFGERFVPTSSDVCTHSHCCFHITNRRSDVCTHSHCCFINADVVLTSFVVV